MTKLVGPLFSHSAKGSLFKQLSYFKNFNSHSVAVIKKPAYRNTQLQKNIRLIYILVVNDWQIATVSIHNYFDVLAENKALHGYNIFFRIWFDSIYSAHYDFAIYGIGRFN